MNNMNIQKHIEIDTSDIKARNRIQFLSIVLKLQFIKKNKHLNANMFQLYLITPLVAIVHVLCDNYQANSIMHA